MTHALRKADLAGYVMLLVFLSLQFAILLFQQLPLMPGLLYLQSLVGVSWGVFVAMPIGSGLRERALYGFLVLCVGLALHLPLSLAILLSKQ